jgi:hypothetical protein
MTSQPPIQLTEEKPFASLLEGIDAKFPAVPAAPAAPVAPVALIRANATGSSILGPMSQALERFKQQKEQMASALEQIESVGNFAIRGMRVINANMERMVEVSNANFAETRAQIGQLSGSVQALMLNSFDSVDPMVHAMMSLIMHLRGGVRAASLPEDDRIIDPSDLEIFDRLTILTMHEGRPMLTIPKECAPVFWAGFAHVFNLHLRMTNIVPFCVRYGVSVDYDRACVEEEKIVVKRGVKRLQKIGRQSAQYRDFHLVISETAGLFRGFMFNTSLAYVMNHRPYGYEGQRFVEWEDGTVNAKGSRVKKIQLLPERKNYEDADALIALKVFQDKVNWV